MFPYWMMLRYKCCRFSAASLGGFSLGVTLAWNSSAVDVLRNILKASTNEIGLIGGIVNAGACVGVLLIPWILKFISRTGTMFISIPINMAGWALICFADQKVKFCWFCWLLLNFDKICLIVLNFVEFYWIQFILVEFYWIHLLLLNFNVGTIDNQNYQQKFRKKWKFPKFLFSGLVSHNWSSDLWNCEWNVLRGDAALHRGNSWQKDPFPSFDFFSTLRQFWNYVRIPGCLRARGTWRHLEVQSYLRSCLCAHCSGQFSPWDAALSCQKRQHERCLEILTMVQRRRIQVPGRTRWTWKIGQDATAWMQSTFFLTFLPSSLIFFRFFY